MTGSVAVGDSSNVHDVTGESTIPKYDDMQDGDSEDAAMLLEDVAKEYIIENMVIISSSKGLPNLAKPLPSTTRVTYDIDTMNPNDLRRAYRNLAKANKQPVYLIVSRNSSATSTVLSMIRNFDYSNTILVFKEPSTFFNNTYFIRKVNENEFYLNEVCMFCDEGRDTIKVANSWNRSHGFMSNFKLASSFKGTFHGKLIRFGCRSQFLYDIAVKRYMGVLARFIDFKVSVVQEPPSDIQKFLEENKTDFTGCYVSMTHQRLEFADFSFPYFFTGMRIYSMKPQRGLVWYAFAKPFGYETWILVLISTLLC